ncbi:MAG: hypothetical protein JKY95_07730 [Planctomycetaceae bacterium]|nr:hypothetical protein [Planctomycetaceae bacterium]
MAGLPGPLLARLAWDVLNHVDATESLVCQILKSACSYAEACGDTQCNLCHNLQTL